MWKSINSQKKRCIALYEITGFVGGMNLTCNSFTSAVHIVKKSRLKRLHHTDKTGGCEYKPHGRPSFSDVSLAI